MQQLQIQFFWPLTEQIPLDLDYTECDKPKVWYTGGLTSLNSTILSVGQGGPIGFSTVGPSFSNFEVRKESTSVGYWEVYNGFNVYRDVKPNWIVRFITPILLGWEWKDK